VEGKLSPRQLSIFLLALAVPVCLYFLQVARILGLLLIQQERFVRIRQYVQVVGCNPLSLVNLALLAALDKGSCAAANQTVKDSIGKVVRV
jgi:hypothetical protein